MLYTRLLIQSMPVIRTLSGIKEYVLISDMFLEPILDVHITGIFSMHMYRNESVSPKDVLISGVLITGIDCTSFYPITHFLFRTVG